MVGGDGDWASLLFLLFAGPWRKGQPGCRGWEQGLLGCTDEVQSLGQKPQRGVVLEPRPLGVSGQSAGDSGIQAKTQTEVNSARDQYRLEQPWGS